MLLVSRWMGANVGERCSLWPRCPKKQGMKIVLIRLLCRRSVIGYPPRGQNSYKLPLALRGQRALPFFFIYARLGIKPVLASTGCTHLPRPGTDVCRPGPYAWPRSQVVAAGDADPKRRPTLTNSVTARSGF